MSWKKDTYEIEEHPFETYLPSNAKLLIIGTFPTQKNNFRFKFFYSGKENSFWNIIEKVFKHTFKYNEGEEAVEERKAFLQSKAIGITDMHEKCYRKNNFSTDENLFPIILKDIFTLLDEHSSIKRMLLTSRTEVFGALGLLKTFFMQKGVPFTDLKKRTDKILEGSFIHNGRRIEILIPYSPSSRVLKEGRITLQELVKMYSVCLKLN